MKHNIKDYRAAFDGAGPQLKERILSQAAQDRNLDLWDLLELKHLAYPDEP